MKEKRIKKFKMKIKREHRIIYLFSAFVFIILAFSFCSKKTDEPMLSMIVPGRGLVGDTIKIKGTNLESATVTFGGSSLNILENSPSEISAVVPVSANIGKNKVTVNTGGGKSNELFFELVEIPQVVDAFPPSIEKTIPSSNFSDYPVLIHGQFFSGVISVSFDDIEAEISTNNQSVVTTKVPQGISIGSVKLKIRTLKGTSTINFNVQGPPPGGVAPVNFSIVNVPPPNYVPLISNQWSCGLFSEEANNTFVELNSDENFDGNFKITGNYEYQFDFNKDYNKLNYVEIVDEDTGEILAGQFSSEFDNPCIYQMILISSETGMISECTVDVSEFGECEE